MGWDGLGRGEQVDDDVTMTGSEPAAVTLDGSGVPPTKPARAPAHTPRASTSARARDYVLTVAQDLAIVTVAFELATVLRFLDNPADIGANVARMLIPSLFVACIYAMCAALLGVHRRIWTYASLREGLLLVEAVLATLVLGAGLDYFGAPQLRTIRPSVLIGGALFTLVLLGSVKMLPRVARLWRVTQAAGGDTRVLIVGAGEVGAEIASRLLSARTPSYRVIAFVDDDPAKWMRRIHGRAHCSSRCQPGAHRRPGQTQMAMRARWQLILACPGSAPRHFTGRSRVRSTRWPAWLRSAAGFHLGRARKNGRKNRW
jgi:hypothetical protein